MGLNRQLVETVKIHFARKSTADLEEIVRRKDRDQWSDEAFVAAEEVLAERVAGLGKEPRVPVKDAPPPSAEVLRDVLPLLGFAFGGVFGGLLVKYAVAPVGPDVDNPVSFGSDLAWVALETTDAPAVATALGLQRRHPVTWKEGVAAASRSDVFVTPPVGDWTLAVGRCLFPPEHVEAFAKPLLKELSRRFQDAQYFCTHRESDLHVWARARKGRFLRGYGWLGQRKSVIWNEGPQTKQEFDLGFRFTDGPTTPPVVKRADDPAAADESCVLQLAALWSVDPSSLDDYSSAPGEGIVGEIPRR